MSTYQYKIINECLFLCISDGAGAMLGSAIIGKL
jgi:hypothetical protein